MTSKRQRSSEIVGGLLQLFAVVSVGAGAVLGLAYLAGGRDVPPAGLAVMALGLGGLSIAGIVLAVLGFAAATTAANAVQIASPRRRRVVLALVVSAVLLTGLTLVRARVTLTQADQMASVISMFVSVAALVVSIDTWRLARASSRSAPEQRPSVQPAHARGLPADPEGEGPAGRASERTASS